MRLSPTSPAAVYPVSLQGNSGVACYSGAKALIVLNSPERLYLKSTTSLPTPPLLLLPLRPTRLLQNTHLFFFGAGAEHSDD